MFSPSEDDIMAQLQQDSSDLEVEPSFALEGSLNGDYSNEGVLMQHMDIREPLSVLRNLLEDRLSIDLKSYSFWLQDAQMVSGKMLYRSSPRAPVTTIKSVLTLYKKPNTEMLTVTGGLGHSFLILFQLYLNLKLVCLFQQLESHKNLVDQCVQGEGLVQINVQIKPMQKRINIVDVLKPADDYIEVVENNCMY